MNDKLIEFAVYGDPVALKRHRTVKTKSGQNINYDPSSSDKNTFAWKAIAQHKPKKPFDEAIRVRFIFYMPRPKSHFGTGKNKSKLKASAPALHTSKPDLDNLVKFVKDALNKIYWKDDSVISSLIARKQYTDDIPKTVITIKYDSIN